MHSNNHLLTTDDTPFDHICDTGTSRCTFCSLQHFPQGIQDLTQETSFCGIASNLPITGTGTTVIYVCTHHSITLRICIPHLPCNLLSPQWLTQVLQKQNKKSSFHIFPNGCLLLIDHYIVPLQYHPQSNLPIFHLLTLPNGPTSTVPALSNCIPNNMLLHGFAAQVHKLQSSPPIRTTPDQYANLTVHQQQLYDWHVWLGHMNFA